MIYFRLKSMKRGVPSIVLPLAMCSFIFSGEGIEALVNKLGSKYRSERESAYLKLKEKGREALPYLIKALREGSPRIRYWSASLLGVVGVKEAVEPLMKALQDKDTGVRRAVVSALGDIGEKRALPALEKLLSSKDKGLRADLILSIGKIGGERAVEILWKLIREEDPQLRLRAVVALGFSQSPKAVPILIEALKDEDRKVRAKANLSLRLLTGKDFGFKADAPEAQRAKAIKLWQIYWKSIGKK